MRWLSGWNAAQLIQMKRRNGFFCELQVPDMHRVKRTAKNADEFQIGCAGAAPSLSGTTSR